MWRRLGAVSALFASVMLAGMAHAQPSSQALAVDPEVRVLVEQFFAAQVAEDADAYLGLWSTRGKRPAREQLDFIFKSGDDLFSDIVISSVANRGDVLFVRVSALRIRTDTSNRRPDGAPARYETQLSLALTLRREDGSLKILSEGSPADALAAALLEAASPEARAALLETAAEVPAEMLIASLSRSATNAAQAGQFPIARDIYQRVVEVARLAGRKDAEGQAFQNIGNAAYFQRDFPAALAAYRERLRIERELADDPAIAEALVGIATVLYSTYEYGDALATYREAAAIQERLSDRNALGTTLISTGNVLFLQGDYAGAIADYRRSRDLLHSTFNLMNEARALEGLGRAYVAHGDYANALEAFDGVAKEGRARNNPSLLGNALLNIGDVHFRLANLDAARTALDESRALFEKARDQPSVGHVWQAIGRTELVAARFDVAEEAYRKSVAVCEAAGETDCVARGTVGLAFAQASQEHYDEAIATYRKAIDAFTAAQKRVEAARAETGLSQALLGRGDHEAARAAAVRAREAAAALDNEDVQWRAATAEARALRRLSAADRAMQAAQDAVAVLQGMVANSQSDPSQHAPADGASAFAFLAVLQAEAGDAKAALATIEQRRDYVLRVAVAANEREISRGMTPDERAEERALAIAVVTLSVRIEQERTLPKPDQERIAALTERRETAMASRRAQQQRLFERLPALREWRGLAPTPPASELVATIPAESSVLAMVIDEDDLLVVTAVPAETGPDLRAHLRAVRRMAVAEKIAALTAIQEQDAASWQRAAADIVALLPEQALAALALAPTAVIVPDDVFWRVPFEALPAGDGVIGDKVTVAYSTTIRGRSAAPASATTAIPMLIATTELAPERVDRIRLTAPRWVPRSKEAAAVEVRRAAEAAKGAKVLEGAAATESAFRTDAASAGLLHIASPFRINAASPLFSRIYFAAALRAPSTAPGVTAPPADLNPADDGMLEMREVFNLESTAGIVAVTDGTAVSMRDAAGAWPIVYRAWEAAGVRYVLAARWPQDEVTAAELLGAFYARIEAGERPPAALRTAQARVRERARQRAPYFWGGWMLIGG